MKITEAWENKNAFLEACKAKNACKGEYKNALSAKSEEELIEVIARNFYWCVKNGILKEWLPKTLNCTVLNCNNCTNLKTLPEGRTK